MASSDPVVISSFARTPIGSFHGSLSSLGGDGARRRRRPRGGGRASRADPGAVDQIIMGCVLAAGLGQAPARQAALGARAAAERPGDDRQQDVRLRPAGGHPRAAMLAAGSADIVVAGGMESMSNAPYLLAKHRARRAHRP